MFCARVKPWSPLSHLHLDPGIRAHSSISLAGEAAGSSWHALGSLQLLPAGPNTRWLCACCSRDLLATSPCHDTAVTLPGQSPECPEDRESSTAAPAHTTPHPRLVPALVPSPGYCIWKKTLMNNSNHKNKHGEQAENICSVTCCLQEGGQNPPPKPAGYICGPLGWGVTTNQGLPKQSTAIKSSCTALTAAGFARKR